MNDGFANSIILWESFKTYMRGKFISQMAHIQKNCQNERMELNMHLDLAEKRHKEQPSIKLQQRLDKIKSDIALLDAHLAAKDIMFSKQRIFEFRDRPYWQRIPRVN